MRKKVHTFCKGTFALVLTVIFIFTACSSGSSSPTENNPDSGGSQGGESGSTSYTVEEDEIDTLELIGISGSNMKGYLWDDSLFILQIRATEGDYFALEGAAGKNYYYPKTTIVVPEELGAESKKIPLTKMNKKLAGVSNLDKILPGEDYYIKVFKEQDGTLSITAIKRLSIEPIFTESSGTVALYHNTLTLAQALKRFELEPDAYYNFTAKVSAGKGKEFSLILRDGLNETSVCHFHDKSSYAVTVNNALYSESSSSLILLAEAYNASATISDISIEKTTKPPYSIGDFKIEVFYPEGKSYSTYIPEGSTSGSQRTFTIKLDELSGVPSGFYAFLNSRVVANAPTFGGVDISVGNDAVELKRYSTKKLATISGMESLNTYKIIIELENTNEEKITAKIEKVDS